MNTKLTEANARYDEALHNYMVINTNEENGRELIAASKALNEAIDEKEQGDNNAQDAIRLIKNLLEASAGSIRRSMGNGKAYEDPGMFMRALCNDVESAAKKLSELVGE